VLCRPHLRRLQAAGLHAQVVEATRLKKRLTNLVCTNATPNPSLKAPTHYGRQRKPGLSRAKMVSVQAYAACLRGRL
jgi:hypothetical protein